jgi:signal transduction histidine kinase
VHARHTIRRLTTLAGPTIKASLFLGFALICVTWLFAGYYFARRLGDLQTRANAISERYMRAQELLTTARGQVLVGSVYVRDALLDPDRSAADEYRSKLEEAYLTAEHALDRYVPVVDAPIEHERVARLRAEIDEFRNSVFNVLATDSSRWPTEARSLLRGQIMPRRESVMQIADEAQALNRSAFVQQQNEIAAVYRATQRRLWESFGVAVLVSFGIALLAAVYVGRLEDRINRQRVKEADNARELHELSMKLLTAQEEERRVIARELHDEIGQTLTAVRVELALAQRAIEAGGGPAHVLDEARGISESTLQMVRDLSHLLHPAVLDDLGLPAAIDSYLKGFAKRHDLSVDLLQDGMDARLPPQTEAATFRIVQEALTNVAKHANAKSCRVYLQRLMNTLLVTIEDDGVGLQVNAANDSAAVRSGLGLIGIRERVARLGGSLRLESAPGNGTRLTVELPATFPAVAEDEPGDVAAVKPGLHEVLGG